MAGDTLDKELEQIRKRKLEELIMESNIEWPDKPVEVTDANYAEFIGKYPIVVVDCWAPWCGPCKMLGPVIDELAVEYKGKIVFGKLNTDENRAISQKHGIMSIPTILFFDNGTLADTAVGALPKATLKGMLDPMLE